jgi:hypothetical protein
VNGSRHHCGTFENQIGKQRTHRISEWDMGHQSFGEEGASPNSLFLPSSVLCHMFSYMKLQFLFRFDRPFVWPAAGLKPDTSSENSSLCRKIQDALIVLVLEIEKRKTAAITRTKWGTG